MHAPKVTAAAFAPCVGAVPEMVQPAAERATATDIQRLEGLLSEMKQSMNRDAIWVDIELEFHGSIARATQNPVIMRIVPVIVEAIVKTLRYAPRTAKDHHPAFREHSAILAAIREKNPEMAFRAMRKHMDASYRRTVTIGSSKP